MRKGISPLVSTVIMIAISIATITIVLGIGLPAIDRAKESLLLGEARNVLTTIDNAIRTVLFEGTGSSRTINLAITGGDYFVFAGNDSIVFDMEQKSDIVERGIYRKEGNFYINTGADVKAYENDYLTDPSLVGYWKLNSANSTNHTLDSSIYKNDGKLYNYPCNPATCNFTTGQVNYSLQFDGVDDYVNCGNDASLSLNNSDFSIEFWIYINSFGVDDGTSPYFVSKRFWGRGGYTIKGGNDGRIIFQFISTLPSDLTTVESVGLKNTGQWYHIVGTYRKGIDLKLYINGVLDNTLTTTNTMITNTQDFLSISGEVGINHMLNGTIDEVRIYNRSLSADEIRRHYYQGLKGRELGTNLVLENSRVAFEVPKIGTPAALAAINTSHLVDKMMLVEKNYNFTPAASTIFVNGDPTTAGGNGYTQLMDSGSDLRRARIKAYIESAAGTIYNIYYTLFSNADFLFIEVKT